MLVNLSEQSSIVNHFLAQMRSIDEQKDRMRFRRNMERVGEIMAYEISKQLEYENTMVDTPLGTAEVMLCNEHIVLATILRAGLPLHNGLLNIFDKADNAFVSAYRKHHKDGSFEISLEYISCPDLNDCILILSDPMLATGASMDLSFRELSKYGTPKAVHFVTTIASAAGVEHITRVHPNVHLWVGAIDDELTAKSYIVPGLGDAGDLAYGSKLQD
ncbi:MAG: uracil phosphoribosyltransferase [Bacteroidota bacterium]